MFWALVETDSGERLRVMHDDKRTGGKAALAFLTGLTVYCSGKADDNTQAWFSRLDAVADKTMCDVCEPLIHTYYAGDWSYTEDEYQFFLQRSPAMQLPEEQFRKAVKQVSEKWTDIKDVIQSVETLLPMLANSTVERESLYELEDTISDFQALLDTLKLLQQREARQVRIKFV